jgi:hypothetical protein
MVAPCDSMWVRRTERPTRPPPECVTDSSSGAAFARQRPFRFDYCLTPDDDASPHIGVYLAMVPLLAQALEGV